MCDKSDAIIGAVRAVFGKAEIRICFFHVMQAVHRWLRKADNGVRDGACPSARQWCVSRSPTILISTLDVGAGCGGWARYVDPPLCVACSDRTQDD